jgi:tetratricopeptide (TPR) repeat protein
MRLCVLAFCYCLLGDFQQALQVIDPCHRFAADHGDSFRAVTLSWEADIYYANGYWQEALKAAEEGLKLSHENLPLVTAIASIHIGHCGAAVHKDMHSIERIKEGLSLLKKLNFNFAWSFWLEILASAYFQLDAFDDALATIDEAIAFGNRIGERVWLPRILATRARILGQMGEKYENERQRMLCEAREVADELSFGLPLV